MSLPAHPATAALGDLEDVLAAILPHAARVAVLGDLGLARALADRGNRVLALLDTPPSQRQTKRALRAAKGAAAPALAILRARALPCAPAALDGIVAAGPAEVAALPAALARGSRLILVAGLAGAPGLPGWLGGRRGAAREEHTRALLTAGLHDVRQLVVGRVGKVVITHGARP